MSGNHPGSRSYGFWKIEGDVVDAAAQLGLVNPPHLAEQPQHLLVLGQHDQRERLYALGAGDPRQDGEQRTTKPAMLVFVDHRHRDLGHVGADYAIVSRDAEDALLTGRLV